MKPGLSKCANTWKPLKQLVFQLDSLRELRCARHCFHRQCILGEGSSWQEILHREIRYHHTFDLCFQYDLYWARTDVTFNIDQHKVANCAGQQGSPMNRSPFEMHQWGKHKYSYIAFLRLREFCFTYYFLAQLVLCIIHLKTSPRVPLFQHLRTLAIPQVHIRSCIWIPQRLRRRHPELACSSLILHKGKIQCLEPPWENPFCFEAVNHMHFEIVVWLNLLQWAQTLVTLGDFLDYGVWGDFFYLFSRH